MIIQKKIHKLKREEQEPHLIKTGIEKKKKKVKPIQCLILSVPRPLKYVYPYDFYIFYCVRKKLGH
jgi:hypothetical protein